MQYFEIFDSSKIKQGVYRLSRSAPQNGLSSIAYFLYGWQKIFTNKNIFSKGDLLFLFITFFSKMYNKKYYFLPDNPHKNKFSFNQCVWDSVLSKVVEAILFI